VFIRNFETGTTERVSVDLGSGFHSSQGAAVSGGGRYVAFMTNDEEVVAIHLRATAGWPRTRASIR
jgi:hypothetical protein